MAPVARHQWTWIVIGMGLGDARSSNRGKNKDDERGQRREVENTD